MKGFRLYRYALSYDPPFNDRKGLILNLLDKGWGEISPLPGRSRETLNDAEEQLLEILNGHTLSSLFPSVAFGLLCAQSPPLTQSVPLSALLAGTPEQIHSRAKIAVAQGYTSAKVKISSLDLETAIAVIQSLSPLFRLRVDANRAFSFKEMMQLCERCNAQKLEYIEEPTYELHELEGFPYPFALDESLLEITNLPKNTHFKAVIWKPTVMSAEECLARTQGKQLVLSSACETGVGILGIASLAAGLSCHFLQPLGLDTYLFLQRDVLSTPLDFSTGSLRAPYPMHVNTALLQEIAHG